MNESTASTDNQEVFRIPEPFSNYGDKLKSISSASLYAKKNDSDASLLKPSSKKFIGSLAHRNTINYADLPTSSGSPLPCGHNSGQELCYLCHQKAKRNTPVYLDNERKQKEAEEEHLLLDYQNLMDLEKRVQDETKNSLRRIDRANMDTFNLQAAEAIRNNKKLERAKTEISVNFLFLFKILLSFLISLDFRDRLCSADVYEHHQDSSNTRTTPNN